MSETYFQLLTSWPHWALELTVEVATFLLLTWPARYLIRRHDRKEHQAVEFEQVSMPVLQEMFAMQARLNAWEVDRLRARIDALEARLPFE